MKVQENSDEIPPGSMPRGVDVILRNDTVEQAKAGDRVVFTGTLIVVPDISQFAKLGEVPVASRSDRQQRGERQNPYVGEGVRGLKALGARELTYKLCFLACSVQTLEQRFNYISIRADAEDELLGGEPIESDPETSLPSFNDFGDDERARILEMQGDKDLYSKMANSICPSVHGHDEVRKGILLMLFGGVQKTTTEGIKLRGDLNVCIVVSQSCLLLCFLTFFDQNDIFAFIVNTGRSIHGQVSVSQVHCFVLAASDLHFRQSQFSSWFDGQCDARP